MDQQVQQSSYSAVLEEHSRNIQQYDQVWWGEKKAFPVENLKRFLFLFSPLLFFLLSICLSLCLIMYLI